MVPCLAFERLERIHFDELFGIGAHQMDVSILGGNKQQAGVFQQQHLAFAVAAPFPHPVAGLKVEARKEASVVAINVSLRGHHVREIRFQVTGGPEFLCHEFAVDLGDANRPGADIHRGAEQHGIITHDPRLQGAVARELPFVIQPHLARRRFHQHQSVIGEHQHQLFAGNDVQLGRGVSMIARRRRPPERAGLDIECQQALAVLAAGPDDRIGTNHKWGTGKAPHRRFPAGDFLQILLPHYVAGRRIQSQEHSRRSGDEQSAVRERRRGARTGTAHRIFEARFILPMPDFASRTCVVANDRLHRAALFLGEQQIAGDGKG